MGNSFKLLILSVIFSITTVIAQAADLVPEIQEGTPDSRSQESIFNDKESIIEKPPPEPAFSLEQPSVPIQIQADTENRAETEKKTQSKKKKSRKKKSKKKNSPKAIEPSDLSQQASDPKTAVENGDVKRVEKWLEEIEALEKERQAKKVRKPAKKSKSPKVIEPSGLSQQASDPKTAVENGDSKRVEKSLEENEASGKEGQAKKVRKPVKKSAQTFSVYLSPEPVENKTDSKQPEKITHFNLNLPVKPPMMLPTKTLKPPLAPEKSNENKQAEAPINFWSELKSAESGDPEAQLTVGIKLYQGQGVLQDRKQGFKWLLKAAEDGKFSPESLNIIGQAYFKGTDTAKNYVEARKWLNLLADQDNYSAKNDLAYMLYNGLGGDKDYPKAFELFKQAAKHGVVFAQANLGLMYARGIGTEIDKARAYAWYSVAASQGNVAAAKNRNDLLKDMSWDELNGAQRITVELYNEFEKPIVNKGQLEPTKLKPRQFNPEKP